MRNRKKLFFMLIILIQAIVLLSGCDVDSGFNKNLNTFTILSSSENKDLEYIIQDFATENKFLVNFEYTGSLNIASKVTSNKESYDAIWSSNSIWNTSIPSNILKNSKSISVNPVIFAVKESKYSELSFNKNTVVKDLVLAVEKENLKFLMPSVTQTNSGVSAYIGFLNCLANNPPVLTIEDLQSEELQTNLKNLFNGVQRNSGSDEYLIDVFINGDYDAIVNYESSLIQLNNKLEKENKEKLIFIYPFDGVSISDSPFAYIDNNNDAKYEQFIELQNYLLSEKVQIELEKNGRRTSYGGLVNNEEVFKSAYGIDVNSYISPIKYPSQDVIYKSLAMYQDLFRKPSAVAFCLDYSGSMLGDGNEQLVSAMEKILDYNKAQSDLIQFGKRDKIFIILFNDLVISINESKDGIDTEDLLEIIKTTSVGRGTNIYTAIEKAAEKLNDIDEKNYTKSIVLMTDGESYGDFSRGYRYDIPVFSIMFGEANNTQLDYISDLSNGKTFDGREDLIGAFKEIRAYN